MLFVLIASTVLGSSSRVPVDLDQQLLQTREDLFVGALDALASERRAHAGGAAKHHDACSAFVSPGYEALDGKRSLVHALIGTRSSPPTKQTHLGQKLAQARAALENVVVVTVLRGVSCVQRLAKAIKRVAIRGVFGKRDDAAAEEDLDAELPVVVRCVCPLQEHDGVARWVDTVEHAGRERAVRRFDAHRAADERVVLRE